MAAGTLRSSGTSLSGAGATVEPFETQGERRRSQILAITASLIAASGPDAVSHAVVAERAGLVRTAVYRYFPTRDDLLAAVLAEYSAVHVARISTEAAAAGLRALAVASPERIPAETDLLLQQLWHADDWTPELLERRLALIMLQRDAELLARLQAVHPALARRRTTELTAPLGELGLDAIEIDIVYDTILAVFYHTISAALAGTIDRDEAMRLTYRMSLAAVQACLR